MPGKGLNPLEKHREMAKRGMAVKYNTKGAQMQRKLDDATKKIEELERELLQSRANAAGANVDKRTGGATNIELKDVSASMDALQLGVDILTEENKTLSGALQKLKDELQEVRGELQGQIELVQILKGGGGLGLFGEGVASGIETSWINGNLPVGAVESDSADQPLLFFQQSPEKKR